jgi:hypothetical protein
MKPSAKGSLLLGCIDVDIGIRNSYHHRFAIFVVLIVVPASRCSVVPSSRVPLEFEISTRSQRNSRVFPD